MSKQDRINKTVEVKALRRRAAFAAEYRELCRKHGCFVSYGGWERSGPPYVEDGHELPESQQEHEMIVTLSDWERGRR